MRYEIFKREAAINSLELLPWITTRNLNEIMLFSHEVFLMLQTEDFQQLGLLQVYASLFAPNCDGFDVAKKLQEMGFSGRLILLSAPLPKPLLVKREFSLRFKNIDIELAPFPHC